MKKYLCLALALLAISASVFFGGCDNSFSKARAMKYTEWSTDSGNIYFRVMAHRTGFGYLIIHGKKVEAEFTFGVESSISVSVMTEDLEDYEPLNENWGVTKETFVTSDVNEQGQIVSDSNDVVLFGEHFGKVVLTSSEIEPKTVDAWEYYQGWADEKDKFLLMNTCYGYHKRKCRVARISTGEAEKEFIFQWIPKEQKFAIYDYKESWFVSGGEEVKAEGTYKNVGEKLILTFTMDNITDGNLDVIELQAKM